MNERSASDETREDEEHPRLRSRLEGLVRDVVRRTVTQGVGAALQTEESLRQAVTDLKLPKEAVSYILQQVDTTKKELVRVAAKEFREFLESANLGEEIARILTTLSFEIRTEVRFIPNDQKVRPSVTSSMRLRNAESGQTVSEDSTPGIFNDAIRDAATEFASSLMRRGGDDEDEDGEKAPSAKKSEGATGAGVASSPDPGMRRSADDAQKRGGAGAGSGSGATSASGRQGADAEKAEKAAEAAKAAASAKPAAKPAPKRRTSGGTKSTSGRRKPASRSKAKKDEDES